MDVDAGWHQMGLDQWSRTVAPGWEPYLPWYPLKHYKRNLEIWGCQVTSGEKPMTMKEMVPMIVGRLRGQAKRLAWEVTIDFPALPLDANGNPAPYPSLPILQEDRNLPNFGAPYGTRIKGATALTFPGKPPDEAHGFKGIPSGLDALLMFLEDQYGKEVYTNAEEAMDKFESTVRGHHSLLEYITAFRLNYEQA